MSFGRLKTSPTPAPTPATPATEPEPAKAVITPAPAGGLIIPTKTNVLNIVAASGEGGGSFAPLFPTLVIKGGNAGGNVEPSSATDKEVGRLLPQGKQPIDGVYMAFRVEAEAWPTDFDARKPDDRPSISAAIPSSDPELTGTLLKACENFQFCKDKQRWEVANGGPGHLRPKFQVLVYLPAFDDCVVLQAPGLLKSWQTMSQILAGMADAEGNLVPFPARFEVTTAPWYDKNVYHYFNISPQVNAQGKDWMAKYAAFVAGLKDGRPDMVEAINDWFTGADRACDGVNLDRIRQGASMANPRTPRR